LLAWQVYQVRVYHPKQPLLPYSNYKNRVQHRGLVVHLVFPSLWASHPYFQLTSSPPSPSIYRYKQLKKILKKCKTQPDQDQDQDSPTQNPQSSIDHQAEDAFFHELQSQLISISQHFESGTKAILSSYQSLQRRRSTFSFLAACIRFTSSKSTTYHHHRTADLAEKAYWCRKYARANAVALRKILKKHDKLCDNSKGR
jgi:SPX domain protein involved in polyphosphate accumulation